MHRHHLIGLFIVFLMCAPAAALPAAGLVFSPEKVRSVSQSPYWKLLLHYRNGKSESDGPEFFLSPQGASDPEAELLADIKAFQDPNAKPIGTLKQHPQCAFPERFRYLRRELQFSAEIQPCEKFKYWKSHFHPRSVTVIYAAPYLGSPASMFGHTFMRIDSAPRAGNQTPDTLLDYGISFEAVTGAHPGPEYVIKGLIGSYPGMFSQQAYYLKVNTYVNIESRDLWEYELNLNDEQIDRMLNHIWEMGSTYFNYYFFNRNCSYQLLSLLEVANPDWDLRSHFTVMAVPSDTIRLLSDSGAIRHVHFRPSLTRILNQRLRTMTPQERHDFYSRRGDPSKLTGKESVATLDALLDWDQFQTLSQSRTYYDPSVHVNQKLLIARAKAASREPQSATAPDVTLTEEQTPRPPEDGHRSTKLSGFVGVENGYSMVGMEFRPVFQDLLDPDEGYLPDSTLTLARARVSFLGASGSGGNAINKIRLDDFTAAEVVNLAPWSRLQKGFSWRIGGGLFHPDDTECPDCLGGRIKGGMGASLSLSPFSPHMILYSLADVNAQVSNSFDADYGQSFRLGPSLETGLLTKWSSHWKTLLHYEPFWFTTNHGAWKNWTQASLTVAYSQLPFEIRGSWDQFLIPDGGYSRATLALGWYY